MFYTDINQKKLSQKVSGKLGECIFSHENSKSFWGPKAPTPLAARHQQNWADQSLAPPQTHPKSLKKKKKKKVKKIFFFFFLKNKKRIFLNKHEILY